jgi:NitT/TauT family transport system substrate-binding protein
MKKHILSWFGLLTLIILEGCSPTPAPKPTAVPIAQIRIGCAVVSPDASPIWVAQEAGFFKKNGLEIEEMVSYRGSAPTIQALVSGDIHFAIGGAAGMVEANTAGTDLMMIIGLDNTLNYDLVVQPGITKGQDLKGKKLGVAGQSGSSVTALRYALRELFKLNPDKDVTILFIGNDEDRLAALQAKQVDGAILNPDIAIKAKRIGFVVLSSLWNKNVPYQHTGVAISRAYANKNPEAVRAFVKSVIEAIAFYKDPKNKDIVKKALVKYLKTDDAEYLETGYNHMAKKILQPAPYVTEEGMKTIIAESKQAKAKGLKVSDVTNNAYVKELDDSGFIKKLYQ